MFSPGSIVAGFDPKLTEAIASVLKRLPQRVFWKNAQPPAELGDNIMVSPWIPQNDLLGK